MSRGYDCACLRQESLKRIASSNVVRSTQQRVYLQFGVSSGAHDGEIMDRQQEHDIRLNTGRVRYVSIRWAHREPVP